jgi:hypothetical protein
MIKKILAIVRCALFALVAAVPAFAGVDDTVFQNVTTELFLSLDGLEEGSGFQMRGFAASPDGKYVYGGFLQNYRHVTKFDAVTGERIGEYLPEIENDDGVTANSNYPKGIAIDCRGYMFVGITHDVPASPYISLACVNPNPDADGYLQQVSYITENLGADHTGINGVTSRKIGDKVLVYVATCYDKDTIRCYDVTDVENMHLYTEFGVDGVVDYNELTGSQNDPGYLTVDTDGYIYLCFLEKGGSKGSHVVKIDKDGKNILEKVAVEEAYGISTAGEYVFVSSYGSTITILNKADLSKVTEFELEDGVGAISGCYYAADRLWIGTHGDGAGLPGEIHRTSLIPVSREAEELETMPTELITTPTETEPAETEPAPGDGRESILVFDFSDPAVVSKIKGDNDCTVEYDEERQCMKVTVVDDEQGPSCDPFFTIPMAKANFFDGDKFVILVLRYMTESDCTGEIYYTTKVNRELAANHITYEFEAASEWTDLEIDMRDDDQGNWEGQVRSIRIDPNAMGEDGEVFYFKSLTAMVAEEETEPAVTEPKETKPAETKPADTEPKPAETKENKPAETKPTVKPADKPNLTWLWIVIGVVVAAAVAAVVVILLKKKKK